MPMVGPLLTILARLLWTISTAVAELVMSITENCVCLFVLHSKVYPFLRLFFSCCVLATSLDGVARSPAAWVTPTGCKQAGEALYDCVKQTPECDAHYSCPLCLDALYAVYRCHAPFGGRECHAATHAPPAWPRIADTVRRLGLQSPLAHKLLAVAQLAPNAFADVARERSCAPASAAPSAPSSSSSSLSSVFVIALTLCIAVCWP